jgi:hypothetical protein
MNLLKMKLPYRFPLVLFSLMMCHNTRTCLGKCGRPGQFVVIATAKPLRQKGTMMTFDESHHPKPYYIVQFLYDDNNVFT